MSITHSQPMDELRAIEFTDALALLQALLGRQVRALVNFHDSFCGCSLEGELERIETLRPDNRAVNLVIAGRQGVLLDPEDTEVLLVGDPVDGSGCLEFHLPTGVAVRVEVA